MTKTAWAWFSPPGECQVGLKVKDDENIWSALEQCTVRIVEVTLSGGGYLAVGDLVEIDLSVNPDSFGGEMKLTALGAYRDSIKVWKEESKQTLYIGNGTYSKTWAPDALPATLWVEGISPTGTPTQAKLTLLYDPPSPHPYLSPVEEIYFTVVEVASLLPDQGTEIDDRDGDPDTKSFVVCIADEGVVTVTATPNPSVSEENLPDCWSLTGGTGDSLLIRTVDKTTPAKTVITCTCNTSSKQTTIYVYEAKLELHADEGEWWPPGNFWGHGWWVLSIDSSSRESVEAELRKYLTTGGWWPLEEPKKWGDYPGGVLLGEQGHTATGSKDWRISFDSLINALEYVKALKESGDMFNTWSNNCTDQAVLVGEQAGVETIDAGSNPTLPSELSDWLNAH